MLSLFPSLSSTFDEIERIKAGEFTEAAVLPLCDIGCDGGELPVAPADPFSPEYKAFAVDVWKAISQRPHYRPQIDEKCEMDVVERANRPSVYMSHVTSASLGRFLEAAGTILKALDMAPGQKLLEYGAGEGQISLHLARMGVDVSIIDIEPAYLEAVNLQAKRNNISIRTKHGTFLDDFDDDRFDRILFFEAFHHALDHVEMLHHLTEITTSDAKIVLAAEPIQAPEDYWRATIPYPWGPRLDGLSMNAMRSHGWMELGFRSEYIVELAARTGWIATYQPCPTNGLGHCWIFTKATSR